MYGFYVCIRPLHTYAASFVNLSVNPFFICRLVSNLLSIIKITRSRHTGKLNSKRSKEGKINYTNSVYLNPKELLINTVCFNLTYLTFFKSS